MNYHEKSKEELLAALDEVALAIGVDTRDPLCMGVVERAKRINAALKEVVDKYCLLLSEYATGFGIEGASLVLKGWETPETRNALQLDIDRLKDVCKARLAADRQLADAAAQLAQQSRDFDLMIDARKSAEIIAGVPAALTQRKQKD